QAVVLQQPLGALRRGQGFKPEIRQHFIPSLLPPLQPMPQVFARSRIKELTKNTKKCIMGKKQSKAVLFHEQNSDCGRRTEDPQTGL
ncbi:MAG: hypothetical protein II621_03220, partial [Clostridia bacterium]|nr:hypothetical protein [Clostridia bacterium]